MDKEATQNTLEISKQRALFDAIRGHVALNAIANIRSVRKTIDLIRFSGSVVVVGAGPSLNRHIDTVRELSLALPVIAASRAADFLAENAVSVDFYVASDRSVEIGTHLDWSDCVVLRNLSTHKDIHTDPERTYWYTTTLSPSPLPHPADALSDPLVQSGSSCVLEAISIADQLGASECLLYGFDCCYDGKASHCGGLEMYGHHDRVKAKGLDGLEVETDALMLRMMQEYQQLIGRADVAIEVSRNAPFSNKHTGEYTIAKRTKYDQTIYDSQIKRYADSLFDKYKCAHTIDDIDAYIAYLLPRDYITPFVETDDHKYSHQISVRPGLRPAIVEAAEVLVFEMMEAM